jgi:hypothetical protein
MTTILIIWILLIFLGLGLIWIGGLTDIFDMSTIGIVILVFCSFWAGWSVYLSASQILQILK